MKITVSRKNNGERVSVLFYIVSILLIVSCAFNTYSNYKRIESNKKLIESNDSIIKTYGESNIFSKVILQKINKLESRSEKNK